MIQLFKNARIDWLANRRAFIVISVLLMLAGLGSAIIRQAVPGGTDAFNLGVDFKGGTVLNVKFLQQRPSDDALRSELSKKGLGDAIIQSTDKADEVLITVSRQGNAESGSQEADQSSVEVTQALDNLGPANTFYQIKSKDAVSEAASKELRIKAITVTIAALIGILIYIAFRFEWTYGAAAVIAVFHDVLVTIGMFSLFQWEISITVIAALLTLVGFSVNDTIVVFDRIRENLRLHRRDPLYKVTNDSINQTLSRTVITSGLVFLSVLAMVLFGGQVLRGFSLALLIGIVFGTYSSIAIASPIMVWWQQRIDASKARQAPVSAASGRGVGQTQASARARRANAGTSNQSQGTARS